jgi:hypothetical protein
MVPPFSETQPTRRSPWPTPAGAGMVSLVLAVVFLD